MEYMTPAYTSSDILTERMALSEHLIHLPPSASPPRACQLPRLTLAISTDQNQATKDKQLRLSSVYGVQSVWQQIRKSRLGMSGQGSSPELLSIFFLIAVLVNEIVTPVSFNANVHPTDMFL